MSLEKADMEEEIKEGDWITFLDGDIEMRGKVISISVSFYRVDIGPPASVLIAKDPRVRKLHPPQSSLPAEDS